MPIIYSQNQTNIPTASLPEWGRNHAALIGLIISEIMSFLPAKTAGMIKALYSIFQELTKKKST